MAKKKAAETAATDTEAAQTGRKTPEPEENTQATVVKHANGITAYNY